MVLMANTLSCCSMVREMLSSRITLIFSFLISLTLPIYRHTLPLEYSATINNSTGTWSGKARIPADYFPPDVTLFNAYAIHGTGDERKYEALYESSGPQPDFHRLEKFQPIDFSKLQPKNKDSELSALWRVSIEESEMAKNQ